MGYVEELSRRERRGVFSPERRDEGDARMPVKTSRKISTSRTPLPQKGKATAIPSGGISHIWRRIRFNVSRP